MVGPIPEMPDTNVSKPNRVGTAARPVSSESCHWYHRDSTPCHFVARADGKGTRPTTLADARKLGLLPSVTTILKVLNKPALNDWLIEQSTLACLTTPRLENEELDAFVHRVLHVERIQDQEASKARDLGTEIHEALADAFKSDQEDWRGALKPLWEYVGPVYKALRAIGKPVAVEKVVVGDGYAGTLDLALFDGQEHSLWDFKTTKNLPEAPWPEWALQLAAYAKAYPDAKEACPIRTGNVAISTTNPGEFRILPHDSWWNTYEYGFKPLLQLWRFLNSFNYNPNQKTKYD